jgi:tetratricopeptide (TPR) repeat protein
MDKEKAKQNYIEIGVVSNLKNLLGTNPGLVRDEFQETVYDLSQEEISELNELISENFGYKGLASSKATYANNFLQSILQAGEVKKTVYDQFGDDKFDKIAQNMLDNFVSKNLLDDVFNDLSKNGVEIPEDHNAEWLKNYFKTKMVEAQENEAPVLDASDLNKISFELRKLGYGEEAYAFAEKSIELDPNNHGQVAANMGNMAYCKGMIEGDFEAGLKLYDEADAYLEKHGLATDVSAIKSDQNKGQIYHRMGMHDATYYDQAVVCYERALAKIDSSETLTPTQKNQFPGQVGYCYAKTLACKALLEPENTELQTNALAHIDKGLEFIESINNFGFERACFEAVKGQVLAACGNKTEALEWLEKGFVGQVKHGPTVMPRIVSTSFKIIDIKRELGIITPDQHIDAAVGLFQQLKPFYGEKEHPDLAVCAHKNIMAHSIVFGFNVPKHAYYLKPKNPSI